MNWSNDPPQAAGHYWHWSGNYGEKPELVTLSRDQFSGRTYLHQDENVRTIRTWKKRADDGKFPWADLRGGYWWRITPPAFPPEPGAERVLVKGVYPKRRRSAGGCEGFLTPCPVKTRGVFQISELGECFK